MNERKYLAVAFVLAAALMYSLPYLLGLPRHPGQDMEAGLSRVERALVEDNWAAARREVQRLEQGWEEQRFRIFFNSEPRDVRDFEQSLSRLAVAAVEEDRLQARTEVAVMKQLLPVLSAY